MAQWQKAGLFLLFQKNDSSENPSSLGMTGGDGGT
jgi:hypothetical protein